MSKIDASDYGCLHTLTTLTPSPDGGRTGTAEDQADLSKELPLVHAGKHNGPVLTDNLNSATVDEEHLRVRV